MRLMPADAISFAHSRHGVQVTQIVAHVATVLAMFKKYWFQPILLIVLLLRNRLRVHQVSTLLEIE
jgi:hypothetical protein